MTIHTLTTDFILARQADGRAPRTISDYHRTLNNFTHWFTRHAQALDRDTIRRYVASLYASDWSLGTVGIYVRNLRAFLHWLHLEGKTQENLARAVKAPKPATRIENLPTDRELLDLIHTCQDDRQALRDRALILTFLDTGLRIGELVKMQRADLHFDPDLTWFQIHATKNDVIHLAFLGQVTTCALLQYLDTRDDALPALWTGLRGPLTPTGIYKALRRRALQADLDPRRVHPHAFRKLFATLWTENGGDRTRLKCLGGWRSDAMLDRYVLLAGRAKLAAGHHRYAPVDHLLRQ